MVGQKIYTVLLALLLLGLLSPVPDSRSGLVVDFDPQGQFEFVETAEQAITYANAYLQRHTPDGATGPQLRLRLSPKDALDNLARQAQLAPTDLTLQTALGVTLFGAWRAKDAQRHFEQAVRTNPSYAIGHCYLASLALNEGDFNGFVKHFELAIQADPAYVPAYNSLAIIYSTGPIGNINAAFRVLSQGIARLPGEPSFFINQALLYADNQHWGAAQESLQQAISIQPTEYNRLLLGMTLLKRHEYERARAVFNSILETNPKSIVALAGLADSYKGQHDHATAIALIEQAIALEPENKDLRDELREHHEAFRTWKNQEKKE
ncbi:MAG: tetratricopeptide repeat protein [Nitrospira sp.]|nr:tetratricopeptide repeat protein [Nitrospira sp.]